MNNLLKNILPNGIKISEAFIQAELYHFCKVNNISIYLEQFLSKTCRCDALIEIGEKLFIIECKCLKKNQYLNIYTRQMEKYISFKLPIIFLEKIEDIIPIINILIQKSLGNYIYIYDDKSKELIKHNLKEINKKNRKMFALMNQFRRLGI